MEGSTPCSWLTAANARVQSVPHFLLNPLEIAGPNARRAPKGRGVLSASHRAMIVPRGDQRTNNFESALVGPDNDQPSRTQETLCRVPGRVLPPFAHAIGRARTTGMSRSAEPRTAAM